MRHTPGQFSSSDGARSATEPLGCSLGVSESLTGGHRDSADSPGLRDSTLQAVYLTQMVAVWRRLERGQATVGLVLEPQSRVGVEESKPRPIQLLELFGVAPVEHVIDEPLEPSVDLARPLEALR